MPLLYALAAALSAHAADAGSFAILPATDPIPRAPSADVVAPWALTVSAAPRPVLAGAPPLETVEVWGPQPGEQFDPVLSPAARHAAWTTTTPGSKSASVRIVDLDTGVTRVTDMVADSSAMRPAVDDGGGVRVMRASERVYDETKEVTTTGGGTVALFRPFGCIDVWTVGADTLHTLLPVGASICGPSAIRGPERVRMALNDDGSLLAATWGDWGQSKRTYLTVWTLAAARDAPMTPREVLTTTIRDVVPRAIHVRDDKVILVTGEGLVRRYAGLGAALAPPGNVGSARLAPDGRSVIALGDSDAWVWDPAAGLARAVGIAGNLRDLAVEGAVGLVGSGYGVAAVALPSGAATALPQRLATALGRTLAGVDWPNVPGHTRRVPPFEGVGPLSLSADGARAAYVHNREAWVYDTATASPILGPLPVAEGTRAAWVGDAPAFLTPTGVLFPAFGGTTQTLLAKPSWALDPTGTTVWRADGRVDVVTGSRLPEAAPGEGFVPWSFAPNTGWLRDVGSGRPIAPLPSRSGGVRVLALAPDGHTVYSGHTDGTVRAWNLDTLEQVAVVATLPGPVIGLSGWGARLAAATADAWFLWDRPLDPTVPAKTGPTRTWNDSTDNLPLPTIALGADRLYLLVDRDRVHAVDPATGTTTWAAALAQRGPGSVDGIALAPDGAYLAVATWDGAVHVLDAATGAAEGRLAREVAELRPAPTWWEGRVPRVEALGWDERGIIGLAGPEVRVWARAAPRATGAWATSGRAVPVAGGVAQLQSGGVIGVRTDAGVWRSWGGHRGDVYALVGTPPGGSSARARLVSGGADGTLRVWSPDGAPLAVLYPFRGGGWIGHGADGALHRGGAHPWLAATLPAAVPTSRPKLRVTTSAVTLTRGAAPIEVTVQVTNVGTQPAWSVSLDPAGLPPGVSLWPTRTADLAPGQAADVTAILEWAAPPDGAPADTALPPGTTSLPLRLRVDGAPAAKSGVGLPIQRRALDLSLELRDAGAHATVTLTNAGLVGGGPLYVRLIGQRGGLPAWSMESLAAPGPGATVTLEVPYPAGATGPWRVEAVTPGWPGTRWVGQSTKRDR
ncbi:MAG: hypothetical protein V4850_02910 [Myxococcota bacterium]